MTGLVPGSAASRLAAVALLLCAALVPWWLVAAPLLDMRDALDEEIALTRASNARLYAQVAGTAVTAEPAVLTEATPALAAARLQGTLESVVERAGGRIERLEAATPPRARVSGRLEPVRGSVTFTATVAQLRRALLDVETAPIAMMVDELSVASASTDQDGDGRLTVDLAVRAFRLKGRRP